MEIEAENDTQAHDLKSTTDVVVNPIGNDASPSKLSPKLCIAKQSPARKSIARALKLVRVSQGRLSSGTSQVGFVDGGELSSSSKEPLLTSFSSKLALGTTIPTLSISEISEVVNFRFCFEGKVLCKYGTYRISGRTYPGFLKADLVDVEAKHTITLVVSETFIQQFVEAFNVNDYLRIEGVTIKRKVKNDGGTSLFSLHVDATTLIIKAEPFMCDIVFFPECKIRDIFSPSPLDSNKADYSTIAFTIIKIDNIAKSDGNVVAQLTIADGPLPIDRATLSFVPTRKADYYIIVDEVNSKGFYACVARNIGVFKNRANTLSIVDCTILTPLPSRLESQMRDYLLKQKEIQGFGKKVFGTLEITNINSFTVEFVCTTCKSSRVSRQITHPFCYSCNKISVIVRTPSLQARITLRDASTIDVFLHGAVVDKVLQLQSPFIDLYSSSLGELKCMLMDIKKVGTFTIDIQGHISDYKAEF